MIYPVDGAIQRLNDQSEVVTSFLKENRFRPLLVRYAFGSVKICSHSQGCPVLENVLFNESNVCW